MSSKIFNNEEQDALNFLQEKKNIIISIQQRTAKKNIWQKRQKSVIKINYFVSS
jgi:hypothetical protein